jgi:hypothetical protein
VKAQKSQGLGTPLGSLQQVSPWNRQRVRSHRPGAAAGCQLQPTAAMQGTGGTVPEGCFSLFQRELEMYAQLLCFGLYFEFSFLS